MKFVLFSAFTYLGCAVAFDEGAWHQTLALARRQASGAKYQCHSECGNAIIEGRTGLTNGNAHCTNAEWKSHYNKCMGCAIIQDIWKNYQNGVDGVAKACGLSAQPVTSNSTMTMMSPTASTASSTSPAASTNAPSTTSPSAAAQTQTPGGAGAVPHVPIEMAGVALLGVIFW